MNEEINNVIDTPSLDEIDVNLGWDDEDTVTETPSDDESTDTDNIETASPENDEVNGTDSENGDDNGDEVEDKVNPLSEYEVKIDHTSKSLADYSKDDIINNFQKGVNYDRLVNRLEGQYQTIHDVMDIYNDIGDFGELDVAKLTNLWLEQALDFKSKKDNTTPETTKKEFELKLKERELNKPIEKERDAKETLTKTKDDFKKTFPKADMSELKDDFFNKDNHLVEYAKQQNDRLQSEVNKLKKEVENIKRNPNATVKPNSNNKAKDAMFAGWDD